MRSPLSYLRHEVRKNRPDGGRAIYCRSCGREIAVYARSQITSVEKCAICVLKEQGVLNPEDHVLPQYTISSDQNRLPVPRDVEIEAGMLLLYPEEAEANLDPMRQSGGVVGTVKTLFRAFGFGKPQDIQEAEKNPPVSKQVAKSKRGSGLYGKQ